MQLQRREISPFFCMSVFLRLSLCFFPSHFPLYYLALSLILQMSFAWRCDLAPLSFSLPKCHAHARLRLYNPTSALYRQGSTLQRWPVCVELVPSRKQKSQLSVVYRMHVQARLLLSLMYMLTQSFPIVVRVYKVFLRSTHVPKGHHLPSPLAPIYIMIFIIITEHVHKFFATLSLTHVI